MRRVDSIHRPAALAAVALLLAGTVSCNDIGEDGSRAEAVPLVTSIGVAGLSVGAADDTTATLTVALEDRTGSATSFFNDVNFTAYSVVFTPTAIAPDIVGVFNTGFCAAGTSCTLIVTLVAAADKAAIPAGTILFGELEVVGRDVRGHDVSFTATIGLAFTT